MSNLKNFLKNIGDEGQDALSGNDVEVFADSVKQGLTLASRELNADISVLDYEILEKGTSGLLGIGRKPYHLLVRKSETASQYKDILDIEKKLSNVSIADDIQLKKSGENVEGKCKNKSIKIRNMADCFSPKRQGKKSRITGRKRTIKVT
jgi:hypothetical protein